MDHTIVVTLNNSTTPPTVRVYPNPLLGYQPPVLGLGDTIVWIFDESARGRDLQPLFVQVLDLVDPSATYRPCNPLGPLYSLELVPDGVKGTVRWYVQDPNQRTRFFYQFLEKGVPLNWDPRVDKAPDQVAGGGIDVPVKPPT